MARHFIRLLSMFLVVLAVTPALAQQAVPDAPLTQADLLRPNGIPVDFYDGLRAWDAGLHEVAVALWLRAAALGDTKSMLRVAQEYESGKYLPKQKLLAAYFKLLAQRQGHEGPNPLVGLTESERAAVVAKAAEFSATALPDAPVPPTQKTAMLEDLTRAAGAGDLEEVRRVLAINSGALNRPDGKGWSALMHAAAGGHADIVQFLLDSGANVAAIDANGYSPLHLAAYSGSEAVVKLLLAHGAVTVAASAKGMTASFVARQANHPAIADMLAAGEKRQIAEIQTRLAALGYDVGKADGEMGPRTATQLAIFAAGEKLPGPPTAKVLARLFAKPETQLWGAVVRVDIDGKPWEKRYVSVAGKKPAAEQAILQSCNGQKGWANCTIKALLPQGTCVSASAGTRGSIIWSRAFAEIRPAEADSQAQCQAAGGRDCKVLDSFCVRE